MQDKLVSNPLRLEGDPYCHHLNFYINLVSNPLRLEGDASAFFFEGAGDFVSNPLRLEGDLNTTSSANLSATCF